MRGAIEKGNRVYLREPREAGRLARVEVAVDEGVVSGLAGVDPGSALVERAHARVVRGLIRSDALDHHRRCKGKQADGQDDSCARRSRSDHVSSR